MKDCICCKTNKVGKSTVMCENCWFWITEKMEIADLAVVVAHIHHRKPEDKHAKEICEYLVADNYTQGKAHLPRRTKEVEDKTV